MLKYTFSVFAFSSLIATSALATNIIDKINKEYKQNEVFSNVRAHMDGYVDFTGNWQGSCKEDGGVENNLTLKIKNNNSKIQLNGHTFDIGLLATSSVAKPDVTDYEHKHFYWNTTKDKLLVQEVSVWTRYGQSKINSNFGTQVSNSVFSLNGEQLQIRGVSFEFNDTNEDGPQQNGYAHTSICTFTKVA
ncbi:hypothetical protein ACNVED_13795 [Legionella sp. D16C41]|uniref:hypothetical protein n=1 Tax=Legionella sp. D16C41 TaxID=3402688 RepID=UPI003AF867F3